MNAARFLRAIGLILFISLSPTLGPAGAWAGTIHVSATGSDISGDGSAPSPYQSIHKGMSEAVSGDTVLVSTGFYSTATTGETFPIDLKSGVILQGQLSAGTLIMGGGAYPVIRAIGVDTATTLDGFTVTRADTATTAGGGIYCLGGSPTISRNVISGNGATLGGGIYCENSTPTISNNTIVGNGGQYGGGIYCLDSTATVSNNTVVGNNSPSGSGGGIYRSGGLLTIFNCIVWQNTDDLYDCQATYSDISSSDDTAGAGNISTDPLFVDQAAGDYHLAGSSACVDAGTETVPAGGKTATAPSTDQDANLRPVDGDGDAAPAFDIGAYEYRIPAVLSLSTSESAVAYGGVVHLSATMDSSFGALADHGDVTLWRRPNPAASFTQLATAGYDQATHRYKATVSCTENTEFQMRHSPAQLTDYRKTGAVSLTFDDGWANQYLAYQMASAYGIKGTVYAIAKNLTHPKYLNAAQMRDMTAGGWEIGSHTVSHPRLTEITAQEADYELGGSRSILESLGLRVTTLAFPYGDYNDQVADLSKDYYAAARTTKWGLNSFPPKYLLTCKGVDAAGSLADIKGWIDEARAQKKWQIILLHDIRPADEATSPHISIGLYGQILDYLDAKALPTPTVAEVVDNYQNATYAPAVSNVVTTRTRAYLSRPRMYRSTYLSMKHLTLYGYLKPQHGGYTRLYFYRLMRVGGKLRWRYVAKSLARNYPLSTYTKYKLVTRFRTRARYRVRAYHGDLNHLGTWSGYTYFYIR